MKTVAKQQETPLALAIAACLLAWQPAALAQEETSGIASPAVPVAESEQDIEEVVVTGRFISSSQQLVNERMNDAFATDLLGADAISRLGDSTVAAALRRVPGLTLVQDKFVYIRGLGERYSMTTLNGAFIPSPDLTRNVIPLDVFPTSVVESLSVQKSWAPELSANFGGGAVDIRTKGIPDAFTLKFEAGIGVNAENPSNVLTYPGGGDDSLGTDDGTRKLSGSITDALVRYQGSLDPASILSIEQRDNPDFTRAEAEAINRSLALDLNREIGVEETSAEPDYGFRASVGNSFDIGSNWEAGFAVGGSYDTEWRWRRSAVFAPGQQDTNNGVREETTRSVNMAGTLNFGLKFTEDHEIETTTLWLRNTDDETEVFDFRNEERSGAQGFRDTRLEFEEREMITNQVRGTHYFGDATRDAIPLMKSLLAWFPVETRVDWFYSTSEADTDIPNRVLVSNQRTVVDEATGQVQSSAVDISTDAASFRFVDLDDEVENYGVSGMLPLEFGGNYVEISGGYSYSEKVREYEFYEYGLGVPGTTTAQREQALDDVFSDAIISDPSSNAEISRKDARDSYFAATMTDGVFGQVDWTMNDTWRVAVGARWEDYRQAAVAWDPFAFGEFNPQVDLVDSAGYRPGDEEFNAREFAFSEDEIYPSVGITYIGDLWAETFQVRLGYSETAVRPDLREITASSYSDPLTGYLTRGNPGVIPSAVDNFDLRFEWFFGNGDNFTVTGFHKDIDRPIAFFYVPASDTTIARSIENAVSAEVTGIEIEGLKELGFLGGWGDLFFVQGNLTLQDSEILPGDPATGEGSINVSCMQTEGDRITSNKCALPGASDYVFNLMLGFDSPNSKHTASLIYNVFDDRVFTLTELTPTGDPIPDVIEESFDSLDFTYFWYPTDTLTVKAKVQNILNSTVELTTGGLTVFEEDPGTSYTFSVVWGF